MNLHSLSGIFSYKIQENLREKYPIVLRMRKQSAGLLLPVKEASIVEPIFAKHL